MRCQVVVVAEDLDQSIYLVVSNDVVVFFFYDLFYLLFFRIAVTPFPAHTRPNLPTLSVCSLFCASLRRTPRSESCEAHGWHQSFDAALPPYEDLKHENAHLTDIAVPPARRLTKISLCTFATSSL